MATLFRVLRSAPLLAAVASLPLVLRAQIPTTLTPFTSTTQLDSDMSTVVHYYDIFSGTPIINLTPQDARQQISVQETAKVIARDTGVQLAPMPVGQVIDGKTITGVDGYHIPIRIYKPTGAPPASGYYPVILYFHGGGFVVATIDTYDSSARALADYANAIVVSVEYRKAPEAPYPDPLRDAYASYPWVVDNIRMYDGDPTKIAIAGESAGGNLAINLALHVRGTSMPQPTYELLIYPETSNNTNQASDTLYTSPLLPLNTPALLWFDGYYNPNKISNEDTDPVAYDLKGLPPTTIIAAQFDPLVSDGIAYANKLTAAGVKNNYRFYTGVTHEFFGLGAVVAKAKQAELDGAADISSSFTTATK